METQAKGKHSSIGKLPFKFLQNSEVNEYLRENTRKLLWDKSPYFSIRTAADVWRKKHNYSRLGIEHYFFINLMEDYFELIRRTIFTYGIVKIPRVWSFRLETIKIDSNIPFYFYLMKKSYLKLTEDNVYKITIRNPSKGLEKSLRKYLFKESSLTNTQKIHHIVNTPNLENLAYKAPSKWNT